MIVFCMALLHWIVKSQIVVIVAAVVVVIDKCCFFPMQLEVLILSAICIAVYIDFTYNKKVLRFRVSVCNTVHSHMVVPTLTIQ